MTFNKFCNETDDGAIYLNKLNPSFVSHDHFCAKAPPIRVFFAVLIMKVWEMLRTIIRLDHGQLAQPGFNLHMRLDPFACTSELIKTE